MKLRIIMIVVALAGVAGVLTVEGFALSNVEGGDTLSEIVADVGDLSHAMPFALGALVGHFVSRRKVEATGKKRLTMGLSLLPLAVGAHFIGGPAWVTAVGGLLAGWVLWPLSR